MTVPQLMPLKPRVIIYTDGACSGNPGPGGWGAVLEYADSVQNLSGYELFTTNNRMELRAALEALKSLSQPSMVELYTDSKYLQQGITQWIYQWQRSNWLSSNKQPVKNIDLWQNLYQEYSKHLVQWHWVKGHAANRGNVAADRLATQSRDLAMRKVQASAE